MTGAVRESKASDQLYYLKRSHLTHLPLSPLQARRVNGALGTKQDPESWLSPRQKELAKIIKDALTEDSDALKGLERPTELSAVAAYEDALRIQLAPSQM
jgi:hypothetical protein